MVNCGLRGAKRVAGDVRTVMSRARADTTAEVHNGDPKECKPLQPFQHPNFSSADAYSYTFDDFCAIGSDVVRPDGNPSRAKRDI